MLKSDVYIYIFMLLVLDIFCWFCVCVFFSRCRHIFVIKFFLCRFFFKSMSRSDCSMRLNRKKKEDWEKKEKKTWWLKSDDRHCCIYVRVCVLWPSRQGEVGYVQLVSIDIEERRGREEGEKDSERERTNKRANEGA